MASAANINARLDQLEAANADIVQRSYHGIAARLDRLPAGKAHRKVLWLIGGVAFCDCLDMNIAGPIIAQLLASGWSDNNLNSIFVSMTAFGYLIGGLLAGIVSDKFGRRKGLVFFTALFSVFCLGAAFAPDMNILIACRFFMGFGLGAAYPAGYGSLSEYTPPKVRGRYQAWVGLIANCGTPIASFLCLIMLPLVGWRAIFGLCGCVGVVVAVLVLKYMDDSPRWLAQHGRNEEADAIVTKYENIMRAAGHQVEPVPDVQIEAEASKAAAQEVKQLPFSFLFTKKMLPRTIVACTICFVNFVCVYTIVTWTPTIFVSRGFDVTYSVALTTIMLLGIPVGVALLSVFVDKLGRKIQLVVGFVLTAIFGFLWALIPVDQAVLIIVVGFLMTVITYYWSLICSSVYLPEPFPTQIRVRGAGFANAFGRIGAILNPIWIAFFLNSGIGAVGVYLASGGIAIVGAVIVAALGVETRGKSLEEISQGVLEGGAK